jgi:hypothetical protein
MTAATIAPPSNGATTGTRIRRQPSGCRISSIDPAVSTAGLFWVPGSCASAETGLALSLGGAWTTTVELP